MKPFSSLTIDSRKLTKSVLNEIEDILYGTDDTDPRLPPVDEIVKVVSRDSVHKLFIEIMVEIGEWIWNPFKFRNDTIDSAIRRWAEESVIWVPDGEDFQTEKYAYPSIAYKRTKYVQGGADTYEIQARTTTEDDQQKIKDLIMDIGGGPFTGGPSDDGSTSGRYLKTYRLTY